MQNIDNTFQISIFKYTTSPQQKSTSYVRPLHK